MNVGHIKDYSFLLIELAGVLISLASAAYILFLNPRVRLNRLFFFFSAIALLYFLANVSQKTTANPVWAHFYADLSGVLWAFFLASLVHFSIVYANRGSLRSQIVMRLNYFAALVMAGLCLRTGWIYSGIRMTVWGFIRVPGPYYWTMILYSLVMATLILYLLWVSFRTALDEKERKQSLVILFGSVFALVIIPIIRVGILWQGIFQPSIIPAAAVLFYLFFALAVVRYGLCRLGGCPR